MKEKKERIRKKKIIIIGNEDREKREKDKSRDMKKEEKEKNFKVKSGRDWKI